MNSRQYVFSIEDAINYRKKDSRLTPIRFISGTRGVRIIECKCVCGTIKNVTLGSFIRTTISCGCAKMDKRPNRVSKYPLHLRKIYYGMVGRCRNINEKNYGGKGVVVCNEWLTDKFSFLEWAINNGWNRGLQIDKDIKGNGMIYSPSTCCFVTPKINSNNRSNNVHIFFNGADRTLSEISELTGINRQTLCNRYFLTGKVTLSNDKLFR